MKELFALGLMFIFYGIAIFALLRVFIIANSFRKGIPFVQIHDEIILHAIEGLDLRKDDRLVDIGSGSGTFLFKCAICEPDVKMIGIESSHLLVWWSRLKSFFLRTNNIEFIQYEALLYDYSEFTKVFMYMTNDFTPVMMEKLVNELKEGTIVVSASFDFGNQFNEDVIEKVFSDRSHLDKIYIWKQDGHS